MDSYYGSLDLALKLQEKNTHYLMACRPQRPAWLFDNFLCKELSKGEFNWASNKKLSAVAVTFM